MTYLAALIGFPLLLTLLSLGLGVGLDRLAGGRLPGLLLVPLGFAGLIVVSQLVTWPGALAPLTPVALVAAGVVGAIGGWRRFRRSRPDVLGIGAGLGAYLVTAAPVLTAGRATFPGYLLDTTAGIQLAGAERLLTHGRGLGALSSSSYGATLQAYFGHEYPSGAHTILAGIGRLLGGDLAWLYPSLMAVSLGYAALVLCVLARHAGLPGPAAAAAGLLSAVPALVYAYAFQGSLKEIALLPSLLMLGALIVIAEGDARYRRLWLPLGVVGAAGVACIGFAFLPWLALATVLVIGFRLRGRGGVVRPALRDGALVAATVVILALPLVASLSTSVRAATNLSAGNAAYASDPGNLLRPLLNVQALGVWLGGSHRVDPKYPDATYALIGVMAVAAALGVGWLVRARRWGLLAYVVISLVVWAVLTRRGTTWTDAKVLMLLSPVVVWAAAVGAGSLLARRRVEALLLGAAVAFAVLASDALSYHYTNLAPTARFDELRAIGEQFADDGPTLTPDFDEYTFYELRRLQVDGPGNARQGAAQRLRGGATPQYGHSYDLDALPLGTVERYRTIVVRRSPLRSRPPSNFHEVHAGRFYDVWQRAGAAPRPLAHLPLGSRGMPASAPRCGDVARLAATATRGRGRLLAAPAPATVARPAVTMRHSPGFPKVTTLHALALTTPGSLWGTLSVRKAGPYRLWLIAQVGRALKATVDGRGAGEVSQQTGGDGNAIAFGIVRLSAGRHQVRFVRGGGSLKPGDAAPSTISTVALRAVAPAPTLVTVAPRSYRSLCRRRLDWIEAVR
jgi:hypothetical protein